MTNHNQAYPVDHESQSSFCHSNCPHTVMYATRTKAALSNLKATSLAKQEIGHWNTYVLKQNLSMAICVHGIQITLKASCWNLIHHTHTHTHIYCSKTNCYSPIPFQLYIKLGEHWCNEMAKHLACADFKILQKKNEQIFKYNFDFIFILQQNLSRSHISKED